MKKLFLLMAVIAGCTSTSLPLQPVLEKKSNEIILTIRLENYSHASLYFKSKEDVTTYSDTSILAKPDSVFILWYFGNIKIDRVERLYLSRDTTLFHTDTANQFPNMVDRGYLK